MFRKYTSDQNIVMCWRMLNSRAYRMAGASDCCRHTHLPFARELLIRSRDFLCPGICLRQTQDDLKPYNQ